MGVLVLASGLEGFQLLARGLTSSPVARQGRTANEKPTRIAGAWERTPAGSTWAVSCRCSRLPVLRQPRVAGPLRLPRGISSRNRLPSWSLAL